MSEIVFTCECGKVYKFDSRFSGRVSRCVFCKQDYIVPSVSEEVTAGAQSVVLGNQDIPIPKPPPIPLGSLPAGNILSELGELGKKSSNPSPINVSSSVFSKKTVRTVNTGESERIGRYEIREKIGSGGMGEIFHAWDTSLHRNVTIKTLHDRGRQHNHHRQRFINEARITGRLTHSGIIPVYDLDFDEKDSPYYVMRMLEGRTLEQLIIQYHNLNGPSHTQEELHRLIRQFIDVCQTMAYVHDNNVVHRDIKPANIMLGGYGETVVLDWGLAKTISNEKDGDSEDFDDTSETEYGAVNLTISGGRVGTLGYQSPEYIREGVSRPADDIYALGVTLYFILCNKLPYKLSRNYRGFFEVMATPPIAPHLINSHVSRQLSAVCLCAMAFEKTKRYPSASMLAADLQRWLGGEAVSVYRMKWNEKIQFLFRKNAVPMTVAITAFVVGFFLARLFFS